MSKDEIFPLEIQGKIMGSEIFMNEQKNSWAKPCITQV